MTILVLLITANVWVIGHACSFKMVGYQSRSLRVYGFEATISSHLDRTHLVGKGLLESNIYVEHKIQVIFFAAECSSTVSPSCSLG